MVSGSFRNLVYVLLCWCFILGAVSGLDVTWHPVYEGVSHYVYNISVVGSGNVSVDVVFSNTSFDISRLRNIHFYRLDNFTEVREVPVFTPRRYEYFIRDNATGRLIKKFRTKLVQNGTRREVRVKKRWKLLSPGRSHLSSKKLKRSYGIHSLNPTGMAWYRLEFDAPVEKLSAGWGSSGKVALELNGVEYHPWWNSSWSRRRAILVSNPGGYLDHYQLLLNLSKYPEMSSDCSDIRFVNSDNVTELPYWVESCTSSYVAVWVRVPEIPANGSKTIYLYYGNPSARSGGNVSAVFEFFDDFEDLSEWTITAGSPEVSNSILHLYSSSQYTEERVKTVQTFSPGHIVESYMKWGDTMSGSCQYSNEGNLAYGVLGFSDDDQVWGTSGDRVDFAKSYEYNDFWIRTGTGSNYYADSTNFEVPDVAYHVCGVLWLDGLARLTFDYTTIAETSSYVPSTPQPVKLGHRYGDCTDDVYVDWVRVRKYTLPERSYTILSEETPPIALNHTSFTSFLNPGETASFSIQVSNPANESTTVTLTVLDEQNNTVATNSTTLPTGHGNVSLSVTLTTPGRYYFYWHAQSASRSGRYPEQGYEVGPKVLAPAFTRQFSIPEGGVSLLTATVVWQGSTNSSGAVLELISPEQILIDRDSNYSGKSFRSRLSMDVYSLPGFAYNITSYYGIERLSISSPVAGEWVLRVVDTNLTYFQVDWDVR